MIEVRNLVKKYGDFLAVDHLNFVVGDRQIYGLLGHNGAGKSTTMNMMTGYISATEGSIWINGTELLEDPMRAKGQIGYLPEIPPVYPDMTPAEYLKFAGELKKIPPNQIAQEVKRVMKLTEIEGVQKKLIKSLSKGYRQRVGLACALLGDPPNIILDEPTVGLDPRQIMEVRDLIKSLGSAHTVILSSHILSEVNAICDHVLILSGGRLVASGSPEDLSRQMCPSNVYQFTVLGQVDTLRPLFEGINGLKTLDMAMRTEELTDIRVETETNQDPRNQIFYLLARAQCPIMELSATSLSLEDVFLELTQQSTDSQKDTDKKEESLIC